MKTVNRVCLLIIYLMLTAHTKMEFDPKVVSALAPFKIDVTAPASGASKEEVENLSKLLLQLHIPKKCLDLSPNKVLFCAHNDFTRFTCLKEALLAENNNIIWSLRGGYGSARIIPQLFSLQKPLKEKIVIGYSDITALHLFLSQEWGWKTIHGAVLTELLKNEKNSNNFFKIAEILSGKIKIFSINNLNPLNKYAKEQRNIKGLLTGGNLTLIQTSIGTAWQMRGKDKIIFLEDTNCKPYQLDRTLVHLSQAGLFNEIKAIIFGSFGEDDELTLKTLIEFAVGTDIPIYKTTTFGHNKVNFPLIYNSVSEIIPMANKDKFQLIMNIGKLAESN